MLSVHETKSFRASKCKLRTFDCNHVITFRQIHIFNASQLLYNSGLQNVDDVMSISIRGMNLNSIHSTEEDLLVDFQLSQNKISFVPLLLKPEWKRNNSFLRSHGDVKFLANYRQDMQGSEFEIILRNPGFKIHTVSLQLHDLEGAGFNQSKLFSGTSEFAALEISDNASAIFVMHRHFS